MIGLELWLNLFDAVIVLGVGVPALVMARCIQNPRLRLLGALLATFFVLHGIYHGVAALGAAYDTANGGGGLGLLSEGVVEPVSYLVLLAFSAALHRLGAR